MHEIEKMMGRRGDALDPTLLGTGGSRCAFLRRHALYFNQKYTSTLILITRQKVCHSLLQREKSLAGTVNLACSLHDRNATYGGKFTKNPPIACGENSSELEKSHDSSRWLRPVLECSDFQILS